MLRLLVEDCGRTVWEKEVEEVEDARFGGGPPRGGGQFLEDGGLPRSILPGSTQPTAGAGAWSRARRGTRVRACGCSASSARSMPVRRVHPCASWITQSAAIAGDEATELSVAIGRDATQYLAEPRKGHTYASIPESGVPELG